VFEFLPFAIHVSTTRKIPNDRDNDDFVPLSQSNPFVGQATRHYSKCSLTHISALFFL
jgi:hypothetical protein